MNVQLTNLQQLHDAIMSTWTRISEQGGFHPIVESEPQRIQGVLGEKKDGPRKVTIECILWCYHDK